MTIGFTGTREGMTQAQKLEIYSYLQDNPHKKRTITIDGCCVGADTDFNEISNKLGHVVIGYPGHSEHDPQSTKYRGDGVYKQLRESKPFLQRNEDIVNDSTFLIAAPKDYDPTKGRGGTKHAIRFALKMNVPVLVFYPNGKRQIL